MTSIMGLSHIVAFHPAN